MALKKKKKEEVKFKGDIYPKTSYIPLDDALYDIAPFPSDIINVKYDDLSTDFAYILNDTFYVLRGELPVSEDEILEPGLYKNKKGLVEIKEPATDEDKEKYSVSKNIIDTSKENIIEVLKNKDSIFISVSDGRNTFKPEIKNTDDILKRAIKLILQQKDLDIDLYKDRFADKNAFLNFKQVIKSDAKLSILLFERGCEVLNMKYTIIIEEADDNDNVGTRLKEPVIVKSDDSYTI